MEDFTLQNLIPAMGRQSARRIPNHWLGDSSLAQSVVAESRLVGCKVLVDILIGTGADVNDVVEASADADVCSNGV